MKTLSAERPQLCLGKRAERQGRARVLSWKGLQVLLPPLREVVRARPWRRSRGPAPHAQVAVRLPPGEGGCGLKQWGAPLRPKLSRPQIPPLKEDMGVGEWKRKLRIGVFRCKQSCASSCRRSRAAERREREKTVVAQ